MSKRQNNCTLSTLQNKNLFPSDLKTALFVNQLGVVLVYHQLRNISYRGGLGIVPSIPFLFYKNYLRFSLNSSLQ